MNTATKACDVDKRTGTSVEQYRRPEILPCDLLSRDKCNTIITTKVPEQLDEQVKINKFRNRTCTIHNN